MKVLWRRRNCRLRLKMLVSAKRGRKKAMPEENLASEVSSDIPEVKVKSTRGRKPKNAVLAEPEVVLSENSNVSSTVVTTDAAKLAAIDTSGYVLPSVKVPGRRGRKPRIFSRKMRKLPH